MLIPEICGGYGIRLKRRADTPLLTLSVRHMGNETAISIDRCYGQIRNLFPVAAVTQCPVNGLQRLHLVEQIGVGGLAYVINVSQQRGATHCIGHHHHFKHSHFLTLRIYQRPQAFSVLQRRNFGVANKRYAFTREPGLNQAVRLDPCGERVQPCRTVGSALQYAAWVPVLTNFQKTTGVLCHEADASAGDARPRTVVCRNVWNCQTCRQT